MVWWFLEWQIICQSATHFHQLLEPDAPPGDYSAAQRSSTVCSPGQQATTYIRWHFISDIIWKLIEWYSFSWGMRMDLARALWSVYPCGLQHNDIWSYNNKKSVLNLYLLVSSVQECYWTMNDIMYLVLLKEDSSSWTVSHLSQDLTSIRFSKLRLQVFAQIHKQCSYKSVHLSHQSDPCHS